MQPSEGIPGVVLYGHECRRARAALEAYPTGFNDDRDPDMQHALERMEMMKGKSRHLDTFTLPSDTANKLGVFLEGQVDERMPYRVASLLQVAPAILGMCLFETIHDARQRRFARQLIEMSALSTQIAREQIVAKR